MLHPGREDLAPKPGYEGMKAMKRKKDIGNSILEDMKYVKHANIRAMYKKKTWTVPTVRMQFL